VGLLNFYALLSNQSSLGVSSEPSYLPEKIKSAHANPNTTQISMNLSFDHEERERVRTIVEYLTRWPTLAAVEEAKAELRASVKIKGLWRTPFSSARNIVVVFLKKALGNHLAGQELLTELKHLDIELDDASGDEQEL
jgi:hypothetical protein